MRVIQKIRNALKRRHMRKYMPRMGLIRGSKRYKSRRIAREIARNHMRLAGLRRVNIRFRTEWRRYL